jgi:sugar transferase (PEP-CTERM system associated)
MVKLFGHSMPGPKILLASCEIIVISMALAIIVLPTLGAVDYLGQLRSVIAVALAPSALGVTAMIAVGSYNYDVLVDFRLTFVKMVIALILVAPLTYLSLMLLADTEGGIAGGWFAWYPKMVLIWVLSLVVTRTAFLKLAAVEVFKRRVVVVGNGKLAARIQRRSDEAQGCHFTVVAFVDAFVDPSKVERTEFVFGNMIDRETFASFIRHHRAHEVVVATNNRRSFFLQQLHSCKMDGVNIVDYQSFWEREDRRLDLDALQSSGDIFSDGFRTGMFVNVVKRSFDIIVSITMFILTSPVLLATAILIKLESDGPILYRQERVGLGGRIFSLLKFRSMYVGAEGPGDPQWARISDPRVTRVGSVIRKLRIDELPQLLNVLCNHMSLIGPRPERPYFVERFNRVIPLYSQRHLVKPGITGWAQIKYPYGASLEDARQKLSYDFYYIRNQTLFLDLIILIQTVRIILFPSGVR